MFTRRTLLAVAIVASGSWFMVDQVAWRWDVRPDGYLASLGPVATLATAVFTAAAAAAAFVYVDLTHRLWQATHRGQQAELMMRLMTDYDALRGEVRVVQRFFHENTDPVNVFRAQKAVGDARIRDVDDARFRVSRLFVRIRKLQRAGFLERPVILGAMDAAAVRVFLNHVDPLDQQIRAVAYGSGDSRDREFFEGLLAEYPPEESDLPAVAPPLVGHN